LIDAKSLNKLVHDLEQAFFELTETQERTAWTPQYKLKRITELNISTPYAKQRST
jgi:hypothetical protein